MHIQRGYHVYFTTHQMKMIFLVFIPHKTWECSGLNVNIKTLKRLNMQVYSEYFTK